MINHNKWISSLPKINNKFDEKANQLDNYRWENTIAKKNTKKNTYGSVKKYSSIAILFVCGLLLVSAVKNETRNLQKEINNLKASINLIEFNLDQATLDNEVITSPENISQLAKEYLDTDFIFYNKSQIKSLSKKDDENAITGIKSKVAKKIKEKKNELKKLQALYSKPEKIPEEIKTTVAKKIEEKKAELKNLYKSPKDAITHKKAQKWAAIQVVKVFLGIPIVPGK